MLFTDPAFLFYFLPFALIAHRLACHRNAAGQYGSAPRLVLFLLTALFYGITNPLWLIPFFICIGFDFTWASLLVRTESPRRRKFICLLSVVQNLGMLSVFKYGDFIVENLGYLFPGYSLPHLTLGGEPLPLPPGISFYVFESLSFVIDVYRGHVKPPKNPLEFFAFIGMFPRFIAGPIVRYRDMVAQFSDYRGMKWDKGLCTFIAGLTLKVLFADHFALFVPYAFGRTGPIDFGGAWIGLFAYTFQIYFDFSGYSLMAIGLGQCFGFEFPANFNRPYLAHSLQDFWRRWHMSLSGWLRDYLYIPLGGSRHGSLRTHFNLFITMVLGGLWHGSRWNFILWGVWHGGLLVVERLLPERFQGRRPVVTFILVMLGWLFFRVGSMDEFNRIFTGMISPFTLADFNPEGIAIHPLSLAFCALGLFYCFFLERRGLTLESLTENFSWQRDLATIALLLVSLVFSLSARIIPFLYFQF